MSQPLIVGMLWLAAHNVDVSCRTHQLKWPEESRPHPVDMDLVVKLQPPRPINRKHQKNVERCDRKMKREDDRNPKKDNPPRDEGSAAPTSAARKRGTKPVRQTDTFARSKREALAKMNRALKGLLVTSSPTVNRTRNSRPKVEVNFLGMHEWDYGSATISVKQLTAISAK